MSGSRAQSESICSSVVGAGWLKCLGQPCMPSVPLLNIEQLQLCCLLLFCSRREQLLSSVKCFCTFCSILASLAACVMSTGVAPTSTALILLKTLFNKPESIDTLDAPTPPPHTPLTCMHVWLQKSRPEAWRSRCTASMLPMQW